MISVSNLRGQAEKKIQIDGGLKVGRKPVKRRLDLTFEGEVAGRHPQTGEKGAAEAVGGEAAVKVSACHPP
jgi:hypothetical protein